MSALWFSSPESFLESLIWYHIKLDTLFQIAFLRRLQKPIHNACFACSWLVLFTIGFNLKTLRKLEEISPMTIIIRFPSRFFLSFPFFLLIWCILSPWFSILEVPSHIDAIVVKQCFIKGKQDQLSPLDVQNHNLNNYGYPQFEKQSEMWWFSFSPS